MLTAGVDIGSRTVKAVVWRVDGGEGEMVGFALAGVGHSPAERAGEVLEEALRRAGCRRSDLAAVLATGYGRGRFPADRSLTEITCHAVGCRHLLPQARLIIDIGGQDSKVIALDDEGRVSDFALNDRCAAGTGTFIEMVSSTLEIPLPEASQLAEGADGEVEVSATCAVFAQSEIVGLIQGGVGRGPILKGVFRAVARRTRALVERLGRTTGPAVLSGGVALNRGLRRALEEELQMQLFLPEHPQLTGALGAAILAARTR